MLQAAPPSRTTWYHSLPFFERSRTSALVGGAFVSEILKKSRWYPFGVTDGPATTCYRPAAAPTARVSGLAFMTASLSATLVVLSHPAALDELSSSKSQSMAVRGGGRSSDSCTLHVSSVNRHGGAVYTDVSPFNFDLKQPDGTAGRLFTARAGGKERVSLKVLCSRAFKNHYGTCISSRGTELLAFAANRSASTSGSARH